MADMTKAEMQTQVMLQKNIFPNVRWFFPPLATSMATGAATKAVKPAAMWMTRNILKAFSTENYLLINLYKSSAGDEIVFFEDEFAAEENTIGIFFCD